jgi:signal recognition particle GTPase
MIQTLFGSLEEEKMTGFFDRMKQAVTRTRENLAERIEEVVSLGKEIDRGTLDDLEATLIGTDLGNTTTQEVLGKLRDKADRKQIKIEPSRGPSNPSCNSRLTPDDTTQRPPIRRHQRGFHEAFGGRHSDDPRNLFPGLSARSA